MVVSRSTRENIPTRPPEAHDLVVSPPEAPQPAWQKSAQELETEAKEGKRTPHQFVNSVQDVLSGNKPAVVLTGLSGKDETFVREFARNAGIKA